MTETLRADRPPRSQEFETETPRIIAEVLATQPRRYVSTLNRDYITSASNT